MSKDEHTENEILELFEYIEHFNIHFRLLLRRYKRFKEIYSISNATNIDVITYIDMIIVQLRAMCIENERYKNNFIPPKFYFVKLVKMLWRITLTKC